MSATKTVLGTSEFVKLILDELDPEQELTDLMTVSVGFLCEIARQRWKTKYMRLDEVYRRFDSTSRIPPYCSLFLTYMNYTSFYDPTVPRLIFPNVELLMLTGNVHRDLIMSIGHCFPRLKTISLSDSLPSEVPIDEVLDKLPIQVLVSHVNIPEKMCRFFEAIARNKSIKSVSFLIIDDSGLQAAINAGSFNVTSFSASFIDTSLTGDTLLKAIPKVTDLNFLVFGSEKKIHGLSLAQLTAHKPELKRLSIVIDQPELVDAAQMIKLAQKHCGLKQLGLVHAGRKISESVFDVVDGRTFLDYLPQLKWLTLNLQDYTYMLSEPRYFYGRL